MRNIILSFIIVTVYCIKNIELKHIHHTQSPCEIVSNVCDIKTRVDYNVNHITNLYEKYNNNTSLFNQYLRKYIRYNEKKTNKTQTQVNKTQTMVDELQNKVNKQKNEINNFRHYIKKNQDDILTTNKNIILVCIIFTLASIVV